MDTPNDTTRTCTRCERAFPATLEYFSPNRAVKSGLQAMCKTCCMEWQREYRKQHPDRVKANEVNRDPLKRHASQKRTYQTVGRKNRKLYVERHPERVKASSQNQRAKRKQIIGEYTGQDLLTLFKGQGGNCWWCGCKIKGKFEVDHRIPLSRGGTNELGNIVVSCFGCNRSKYNRLPSEWIGRLL
jgi:5-methylcytosine-specific restriction endonuclease McrA